MATRKSNTAKNPALAVIESYQQASETTREQDLNLFGQIRDQAVNAMLSGLTHEEWKAQMRAAEEQFMVAHFNDDPTKKTSSGKWKITQGVPKKYLTAKSALIKYMELNLGTADDLKSLGKSAIDKQIAAANPKDVETSMQRIKRYADTISKIRDDIHSFGTDDIAGLRMLVATLNALFEDLEVKVEELIDQQAKAAKSKKRNA